MQIDNFITSIYILLLGIIIGVIFYNKFDKDYYKISKVMHYLTILCAFLFLYMGFFPAAVLLGFHLAYELNI
uniref:Uncharacterized protein n=1 Tax=viral metagenome TaxID=1070528 RepID=A0A6C0M237_9ZZZZ